MPWSELLYIILVFAASGIALILSLFAWNYRKRPGVTAFGVMMLASAQWSLSVGLMAVSATEQAGLFWNKFEFIGVAFSAVLLLVFAAEYSGQAAWLSRKRLLLLFAVPLLTQLLLWTNDSHALFFKTLRVTVEHGGLRYWEMTPGPAFWCHAAYSYFLTLWGGWLLVRMIVRSFHLYRRQALALLFGILPVIVVSVFDTLKEISGWHYELSPIGFAFMGLIFASAFFRYRLLDVVPVARDRLVDSMSDGMLVLDAHNRIVDMNPAARNMLELSLKEGIGRNVMECLPEWCAELAGCLNAPQSEVTFMRDNGKQYYELRVSLLKHSRGEVSGRLIILHNISDRKQIENTLLKLQQAVETTEVGITITNAEGTIEYSNPADALIHGYRVEELIGRSANIFASPELRQPKKAIQGQFQVYSQWMRERVNVRKDGSSFPVKLISNPIYGENGLLVGTVTVCEDISERKQAEAKLLAAHKELQEKNAQLHELNAGKDKFFSIISHDLRSPFNTMLGLSEILLEQFEQNSVEKNRRYLGNLHRSAERLYALLDNLLTWSRLQRGAMKHSPERFDLRMLVLSTFELFSPKAEQKQIELRHTLAPDIHVFADLSMVDTVLRNLVSNALKFTAAGDRVDISVREHDEQTFEITVTDTGSGIEAERMDNLFRIDVHDTRTGTGGEQGTGLGLILCQELVERNGGKIWAESEVGRGTTFRFTLPGGMERETRHVS